VREAWDSSGAIRLLSVTPGCLGTLRRALPGVEVINPLALLAERVESLNFSPLAEKIALHVPGSRINVSGTDAALLTLLHRAPHLR
jgi:glycolate oxidase iron-sulfur subunit